MAALCISILSPVDLLPRGEIDVRRVPLLGIHNGETLSETPGLDELTWLRVLGRLLYAVADTRFKHCSRTLQVFSYRVSPEESRRPLASQQNSPGLFLKPETCCLKPRFAQQDCVLCANRSRDFREHQLPGSPSARSSENPISPKLRNIQPEPSSLRGHATGLCSNSARIQHPGGDARDREQQGVQDGLSLRGGFREGAEAVQERDLNV